MPSKKKKYNARFPAGRIKKIMQTDEEVGKVALAVPIIISRTLELFVESLLKKAMQVTNAKNAKTLSPSHMKQCILSESRFDFLKDLVEKIPDVSPVEEIFDPSVIKDETIHTEDKAKISNTHPEHSYAVRMPNPKTISGNGTSNATDLTSETAHSSRGANFYKDQSISPSYSPNSVIQYGVKLPNNKHTMSGNSVLSPTPPKLAKVDSTQGKVLSNTSTAGTDTQPMFHLDLSKSTYNSPTTSTNISQGTVESSPMFHIDLTKYNSHTPPPLVPITDNKQIHPLYSAKFAAPNSGEELDEDYDN